MRSLAHPSTSQVTKTRRSGGYSTLARPGHSGTKLAAPPERGVLTDTEFQTQKQQRLDA